MKTFYAALFALTVLAPVPARAIFSCDGTLEKDNFADERKKVQSQLQNTIIEYRKAESDKSEAGQSKLDEIKSRIDKQKKTFQDLDSKYFPRTPVTAYGAACNDKRWLEEAKAKLVEKPEHLGKHWYVWLDKASRKPMAGVERASFDTMAE